MKLLILAVTVMSFAYGQTNSTGLLRSEGVLKFKPTHRGLLYQSDSNGVFTYNREEIDNLADSFNRGVKEKEKLRKENALLKRIAVNMIDSEIKSMKSLNNDGLLSDSVYIRNVKVYQQLREAILK